MNSKLKYTIAAVAILGFGVLAACSGSILDSGNWVRAQTPIDIQKERGLPKSLTLNESESQFAAWKDDTERVGLEWSNSIESARQVAAIIDTFTLEALNTYGPQLSGVPVLGAALPLLTGLAGLVVRRPGDMSRGEVAKEKEKSHEHGRKVGAGEIT